MITSARKQKRNLGNFRPGVPTELPDAAVLMVERLILRLMRAGIQLLIDNPDDLTRYFGHFFDATLGQKERDQFVNAFRKSPPDVVMGYARVGAELPRYAIVMLSEEESDAFLNDYEGSSGDTEFRGAFFDAVYGVHVYADHADYAAVLYQLAKAIIHAGKGLLLQQGALEVSLSGGELAPDENYMPENMFIRVLRVRVKHPYSAPRFMASDPARLAALVFACDVVVDGVRGGVHPVGQVTGEDDSD